MDKNKVVSFVKNRCVWAVCGLLLFFVIIALVSSGPTEVVETVSNESEDNETIEVIQDNLSEENVSIEAESELIIVENSTN